MSILKFDLPLDPLYLKKLTFLIEKNTVRKFIESIDIKLWEIMNNIPYAVPKISNDKGEQVDKPKDQYTTFDWDTPTKNSIAKHILYCGLDASENNRISACHVVK